MCLYLNPELLQTAPTEPKIVYKVFNEYKLGLLTPLYYGMSFPFTSGMMYQSNRPSKMLTQFEIDSTEICLGIHVLLEHTTASIFSCWRSRSVIVKCEALPEDFVAYGFGSEAVYTKIKLLEIL